MTKVIVVEDDDLHRFSLLTLIETRHPELCVAGEAKTGAELDALLAGVTPDIILLDIKLPDMSGVDIARRLKRERPKIKILVISTECDTATVQSMLDIGIEGFVGKKNIIQQFDEAVYAVMQGVEYLGSDISQIVYRIYAAKKQSEEVKSEFTPQEKRIIELCHKKLPGKLIAIELGISLRTVENHKNNMFRKFGLNNTSETVQYAIEKGIIRLN